MTTTVGYLMLLREIAQATKATRLHELNRDVETYMFSADEVVALKEKISRRFGELNHQAAATTGICAAPLGRFTLLPHTKPSAIRQ